MTVEQTLLKYLTDKVLKKNYQIWLVNLISKTNQKKII